jgi:hypothetical protein
MPASTTKATSRPLPAPKRPLNRSTTGRDRAHTARSTIAVRSSMSSHSSSRIRRRCWT